MSDFVEKIILLLPLISICSVVLITSINLYTKIRRNFSIKVNCWFCNVNTRVPYDQFNQWTCSNCSQYNGFDKDGDYNSDIPAQRSIKLNKTWKTIGTTEQNSAYSKLSTSQNGLCESCNRNQEIKVQQLATYEPKDDGNFDEEIERFHEKLERSYQLCYRCQRILKRTLNRVTNNVLGSKLAQIGAKGSKVFDRKIISNTLLTKGNIFSQFTLMTLLVLSSLNLYEISGTFDVSKKTLDAYFPPYVTHSMLLVISYISAVKLVLIECVMKINIFPDDWPCFNFFANNTSFLRIIDYDVILYNTDYIFDLTAVLLSILLIFLNGHKRNGSFLVLFLWSVKMLFSKTDGMVNDFVGHFAQISIAISTFAASIINCKSREEVSPQGQLANNSFHRIYSDCDEDLSENSDEEVSSGASSTLRNKNGNSSIFEHSFNSVKSLSPSNLTTATLRNHRTSSPNVLNQSFGNEFQPSVYSHCSSKPRENLFHHNNANDKLYFFPNNIIDPKKKYLSTSALNSSYRIADDCQSKLTGLNISGINYASNRNITCSSPTPSILSVNRHRSQLLTPARLIYNQDFNSHSTLTAPLSQTSWVAGGFFVKNSMSPQKRLQSPQSVDLHPILSRTSSQSSGFESRTSSLHNGIGNGSRESSITGDADHVSVYSEPTHFSDSVSQMGLGRNINSSFAFGESPLQRPKPVFPISSNTHSTYIRPTAFCGSESMAKVIHRLDSIQQPVYRQFGTQREIGSFASTNSLYNGSMSGSNAKLFISHS